MSIFVAILFLNLGVYSACGQTQALKGLRSDHFIITYAKDVNESDVYKLRDDAEYLYRKITQEFNLVREKLWMWENRAKILIASDRQSYLRDFRCHDWSGACVDYYNRVIYTYPHQQNFYSLLTHELTHIIFREYVGFGKLPLWVEEGVANYMEHMGSFSEKIMTSSTKQLISENKYIKFSELQNIYTLPSGNEAYVQLFYLQSYSMIYFLVNRFSRANFSLFLHYLRDGDSLEVALPRAFRSINTLEDFENLWKRFYLM